MSYAKLRGSGGIQWPCDEAHPDGTERLYEDGKFFTDPEYAQEYLHDLDTGGAHEPDSYKAKNPAGRAFLREAEYLPPLEETDAEYPLIVTTGRTVYHFHTRTKTARAPQLNRAAPDAWVEISAADAARFGVKEGDWTRVETPRGEVIGRARVSDIRPGVVFVPFHYGYWDANGAEPDGRPRAANELTLTAWDPVSKQPYFKTAKARLAVVQRAEGRPSPAPTTGAAAPVQGARVPPTAGGPDADATEA
jgi:predicted molibdopterin-dependent oxidoreductase YjgC